MDEKRKFYEISGYDGDDIEKKIENSPKNYDKRIKV